VQSQLERVIGDAHQDGCFVSRQLLDVAHQQHRSIRVREFRDAGPDQGPHLLALEHALTRVGPGDHCLGVMAVFGKHRQQRFDRLLGPALTAADAHQRSIHDDTVQPGGELGIAVEPLETPERREEGVLHHVACRILVVDEASSHRQHPASERTDHLFESFLISGLEPLDQVSLRRVDVKAGGESGDGHHGEAPFPLGSGRVTQVASDFEPLLRSAGAAGDARRRQTILTR